MTYIPAVALDLGLLSHWMTVSTGKSRYVGVTAAQSAG